MADNNKEVKRKIVEALLTAYSDNGFESTSDALEDVMGELNYPVGLIAEIHGKMIADGVFIELKKSVEKVLTNAALRKDGVIGLAPNMDEVDKVDHNQMYDAFDEYTEGMDADDLEAELQVLYADHDEIDEKEVMLYILQNSYEVADGQHIKEYIDGGYCRIFHLEGDDIKMILTKIDNIEEYIDL